MRHPRVLNMDFRCFWSVLDLNPRREKDEKFTREKFCLFCKTDWRGELGFLSPTTHSHIDSHPHQHHSSILTSPTRLFFDCGSTETHFSLLIKDKRDPNPSSYPTLSWVLTRCLSFSKVRKKRWFLDTLESSFSDCSQQNKNGWTYTFSLIHHLSL